MHNYDDFANPEVSQSASQGHEICNLKDLFKGNSLWRRESILDPCYIHQGPKYFMDVCLLELRQRVYEHIKSFSSVSGMSMVNLTAQLKTSSSSKLCFTLKNLLDHTLQRLLQVCYCLGKIDSQNTGQREIMKLYFTVRKKKLLKTRSYREHTAHSILGSLSMCFTVLHSRLWPDMKTYFLRRLAQNLFKVKTLPRHTINITSRPKFAEAANSLQQSIVVLFLLLLDAIVFLSSNDYVHRFICCTIKLFFVVCKMVLHIPTDQCF